MKKYELTEGQKRMNEIVKVKKVFQYEDITLIIATCLVDYMNAKEKLEVTNVLAPNGGRIPIRNIKYNATLKSYQETAINVLNDFKKRGADVKHELTRTLSL